MDLDEPDESKNIVATDTEDQPKLTEEGTKTARPNQRSPTKSETDDDARPFDDENFWNEPLPAVEGQEKADEPLATIFVQNSVESDPDEGEFEWVPTTTVEQVWSTLTFNN
jgi:hypothetical protein